jgi:hypothetical protein
MPPRSNTNLHAQLRGGADGGLDVCCFAGVDDCDGLTRGSTMVENAADAGVVKVFFVGECDGESFREIEFLHCRFSAFGDAIVVGVSWGFRNGFMGSWGIVGDVGAGPTWRSTYPTNYPQIGPTFPAPTHPWRKMWRRTDSSPTI